MDDIGSRIKELRLERGLTLKQLSEKTGLSIGFLSQVERAKCSATLQSVSKISDAFEVSRSYFFQEDKKDSEISRKTSDEDLRFHSPPLFLIASLHSIFIDFLRGFYSLLNNRQRPLPQHFSPTGRQYETHSDGRHRIQHENRGGSKTKIAALYTTLAGLGARENDRTCNGGTDNLVEKKENK